MIDTFHTRVSPWRLFAAAVMLAALAGGTIAGGPKQPPAPLADPQTMAASLRDLWGEAALRHADGPSYEFFKDLLPPLRYVNTEFRHYPLVLGAPLGSVKTRWVSNGSGINLRANKKPMWREIGMPVSFHVGAKPEPFGSDIDRLDEPRYLLGYLPIVRATYTEGETKYDQEVFASVRGATAEHGATWVRFTARDKPGNLTARFDPPSIHVDDGVIRDAKDNALVAFDPSWTWHAATKELRVHLQAGQSALLMVLTKPMPAPVTAVNAALYDAERQACIDCWLALLRRGAVVDVPETLVNNAWRALVIGNFLIGVGDRMNYSAGNAYDHLYEGECGDAVRSLMFFGYTEDARRMIGPLLDFYRKATQYHVAGHKLQLLTHYYWVTRDAEYVRTTEPVWKGVVDFIITSRKSPSGLLPKDNYAGDINQQVISLNSNANCWRGLRDLAAVLGDIGETGRAKKLLREAEAFRKVILDAVAKSERRDSKFIPLALLADEQPHDPITATRMGSYYNLMAPYIIGSGVFGPGSEGENWMIEYPRQRGGLAMGMIRSMPHQGEFKQEPGVNVLYGLRYTLALLRRDERDQALVGFYGHLAHGMTRDTFIGGEGSRFFHGDRHGRSFYLPPNSASNAMFLTTLRYLLIQDWDLNDDGRIEILRLLYGAPSRWLKDEAVINVARAPTAFGELSLRVHSQLSQGAVQVSVQPPPHRPDKFLIRLPLPAAWKTMGATVGDADLRVEKDGAVEVAGYSKPFTVRFRVKKLR